VNGFVRSVRKQKRHAFAAIGDGSTVEPLQVVMTPPQAEALSTGVSVSIQGTWEASPNGKEQACELHANNVKVLGENDSATYPIQKKFHGNDFLRTLPHLRVRTPHNALLLRLRSQVIASTTQFFGSRDFVQTHPPIITSTDCEGAGEAFTVSPQAPSASQPEQGSSESNSHTTDFFQSPRYLTVSSQLHLEALAQSVSKVWTLSPTFRAERSSTSRHLSEFYMLEAEIAFVEDLNPVMDLVEDLLRNIVTQLQSSNLASELLRSTSHEQGKLLLNESIGGALEQRWNGITGRSWPRITFDDAVSFLQNAAATGKVDFTLPPSLNSPLQAEHEKYLATSVGHGAPVFVTNYPREMKAFYMAPSSSSSLTHGERPTVACFDLLAPELCELAGGSLREHRMPELLAAMERCGLALPIDGNVVKSCTAQDDSALSETLRADEASTQASPLQWYLDLRRYGSVPHGGFGIGFDRLLAYLSGTSNIRDIVTFPRWYGRCDC
jgi:asparaginyl-tRNA synthetase